MRGVRFSMRCILSLFVFVLFSGCSTSYKGAEQSIIDKFQVSSDQLLLVVKVTDVKYTDYSTQPCLDDNCIMMRTWFVYDAMVLDVLSGDFTSEKIAFANMQHSYFVDDYTKEWYVLLNKFTDNTSVEKLHARYYVAQHESRIKGE